MKKIHHYIKRHYKKLSAALAGMTCLSALIIHLPVGAHLPLPAAKPLGSPESPIAAEITQSMAEHGIVLPQIQQQTPQPQQVAPAPPSASTPEANAKQVVDVMATAYAPGPHDNDQWGSKTRMGTQVRPGVIAVDPRIIPLGSRVMIKYPNGNTEYAVAEDTGGAIKGHRIDVAKWTVSEAKKFGIKPVKVYVLETPSDRNEQVT